MRKIIVGLIGVLMMGSAVARDVSQSEWQRVNKTKPESAVFCTPNKVGGQIILTKAQAKDGKVALSTNPNGKPYLGEWSTFGEGKVLIKWTNDGDASMFEISVFRWCVL